jgi:3-phosphoshikimate 1-carboxyvinyltransferase
MTQLLEADALELAPPRPFQLDLRPPGSKSITNRALLFAAIARGSSRLEGCLDSDDTRLMRTCLRTLGVRVDESPDETTLTIDGAGGPLRPTASLPPTLHVGTAGTVARFLGAVLAAGRERVTVDGTPRMRERPMAALIDALRQQGARIECPNRDGYLPIHIGPNPPGLEGGEIRMQRPASSQFVSALVIAATLARAPTRIVLEQGTPARPYVDMTLEVIRAFGGNAIWSEANVLEVTPVTLSACDFVVEPDASAASYFLALAAIFGGRTTITHLGSGSLQGDARFASVLGRMGARVHQDANSTTVEGRGRLIGQSLDLTDMPDMTLTAAVAALHAEGETRITGVSILRHHESDRLAAAATELRKLGATVVEGADGLTITPPSEGIPHRAEIDTYDDHRVAMAFSLAGRATIRDPGCVAKTFPGYFNELDKLGMVTRVR